MKAPPTSRAAAPIPPIVCDHADDVAEVRALSDFRLHVRFFDGTEGTVEMGALVHSPNAGVFAALADPARFAEVGVELGAVTWPGGWISLPMRCTKRCARAAYGSLSSSVRLTDPP